MGTATQEITASESNVSAPRLHLSHLDGLRGLAALYVVLYHACGDNRLPIHSKNFPSGLKYLISLISFGQAAVAIFIVLSGYCLMIPLVEANTTFLRGGIVDYLKRRAKRILPVYYAALAVSLLLIFSIPGMNQFSNSGWDASLPAFKMDNLISHLFLVHNLSDSWSHKIDYPMWSVATEWQIYFVFALVLLPIWRRFGWVSTIIGALILGAIPHWLFRGKVDGANFEFIGLFAFGMAGAIISFSHKKAEIDLRNRTPWGALAILCLIPIVYFAKFRAHGDWTHLVLSNIVLGLATVFLLIYCAKLLINTDSNSSSMVIRILSAKASVNLGKFSYSLYLIHAPVLALFTLAIKHYSFSVAGTVVLYLLVGVPLTVLTAYLFFLAFEKPFLVKRKTIR